MTNGSPLSRFERLLLWSSGGLTTLTGIAYWWMKYFMEPVSEFAAINHPLQPLALKVHILVAPILVFGLGVISVRHVWTHFANRVWRGRRSGVVTASIAIVMVATGYLIQAVTDPGFLRIVAYGHIGVGIVFGLGLLMHLIGVRQAAPSNGGEDLP